MCAKGVTALFLGVLVALGLIVEGVLRWAVPSYVFALYPIIPLYFILWAAIVLYLLGSVEEGDTARASKRIMIARSVKMVVSLALAYCYIRYIKVANLSFLCVFMLFYVVYLAMETFAFVQFVRRSQASERK